MFTLDVEEIMFGAFRMAVIVAALGFGAGTAGAQSLWLPTNAGRTLEFGWARASFENGDQSLLSGAGQLAGTFVVGRNTLLQLEVPIARYADGIESEMAIGAPYIGIAAPANGGSVRYQVGVRVAPWESDNFMAALTGAAADSERLEAYLSEFIGLRSSVQFGAPSATGMVIQGRLGGTLVMPTAGGGADPDLLVDYGARFGRETDQGFLVADLSGRLLATADGGNIADRTVHQVGVSGGYRLGTVTPTLDVRLPVGEDGSSVDIIVRIGARVRW